jgi:hypothetical protein
MCFIVVLFASTFAIAASVAMRTQEICGDQGPELFFDPTGGLQLPGVRVSREDGAEAVPDPVRKCHWPAYVQDGCSRRR